MANKAIFKSKPSQTAPVANTVNNAGGVAYNFSDEHALAQLVLTGTLNNTFYVKGEDQLNQILSLTQKVAPKFLAQLAVYARQNGFMKDTPALLLAILSTKDSALFKQAFPDVIDNVKMLRTFTQIVRSGQIGRRSLGTSIKTQIQKLLINMDPERLFKQSVGNDPSLADVIKLTHPTPKTKTQEALFGYLLDKEYRFRSLPEIVRNYEKYKKGETKEVPEVPFELLTNLPLTTDDWTEIARNGGWQFVRMNLNTFARHGVFEKKGLIDEIAKKLTDREAIAKSRIFPYQLLAAYLNADDTVPEKLKNALQDAMEIAVDNVPVVKGVVVVGVDVSGSMSSPITGHRAGSTSKVRCIDVASLVGAALLRKNPEAIIIPFEGSVVPQSRLKLNGRDSVMTNAEKLRSVGGGATNCSAVLKDLNSKKITPDLIVYVSDNESWVDSHYLVSSYRAYGYGPSATMEEYEKIRIRNKNVRMACIDITPNTSTQAPNRPDILNIGGFSDNVFTVLSAFSAGELTGDALVQLVVKAVRLRDTQ